MSTATISHFTTLATEECCDCHILFAMPQDMQRQRRENGQNFYCPNGHPQHYTKSEVERLREQLSEKERALTAAKCDALRQFERAEASARELDRHKKRTKNGVCPCCTRSFTNLKRHIASKHPEYLNTTNNA